MTSLNSIEYNVTYITDADYLLPNTKQGAEISFADRLTLELNNADSKCTFNKLVSAQPAKKAFEWDDVYAAN